LIALIDLTLKDFLKDYFEAQANDAYPGGGDISRSNPTTANQRLTQIRGG